MTYRYERLGPDQLPRMRSLNRLFGKVFDDRESYLEAPPTDAYLAERLADPSFAVLVATTDGEVIGGLAAYVLRKFERARSEIYIYDLAVDAGHRRRGVATALIRALAPLVRETGAHVVFVQADPGDGPAIALYESLGVREDVHHFDLVLR